MKNLIRQTYAGVSTADVKKSEDQLIALLESDGKVVEILARFLMPPFNSPNKDNSTPMDANFRRACANLLKKYYYTVAQSKNVNKNPYIQTGYEILTASGYLHEHTIK